MVTDVLEFLADQGLVDGATAWTGVTGGVPPAPDKIIAVFETPGQEPELVSDGSAEQAYDRPGFQIRGRGAKAEPGVFDYSDLRDRMGQVYRALHGSELSPATGDPAYVLVRAVQSGPLPLGLDDNDRPEMTWNFVAMREREA